MTVTLGVIADTHIPDRAEAIPQKVFEVFKEYQVDTILHLGDISTCSVIEELDAIAPVIAVRGNLDFSIWRNLPMRRKLIIEEVSIGMTHGHDNWPLYIYHRLRAFFLGPGKFSVLEEYALKRFLDTDIVILGHNHAPANRYVEHQLLFNPGSPTQPNTLVPGLRPSIGIIEIDHGKIKSHLVFL